MDQIVFVFLISAATAYLAFLSAKALFSKRGACGGGCCSASKISDKAPNDVI